MQSGVRNSHKISQKKLNGSPRTVGYTRSQRETEKHTATKGIRPKRIAPSEGRFTRKLLSTTRKAMPGIVAEPLRQSLLEIGNDIFDVLDANRDTHHTVGDADRGSSLFAERGVSHSGGMRDQGFDSAEGLSQRAHAHSLQQACGVGQRPRFKRNHRSEAGHLAAGEFILRMILESRVEDFLDFFLRGEELSDLAAVAVVLQHADSKRFCAAQNQPTLERGKNRARRLLHKSKLLRLLLARTDDNTPQSVTMTVKELRRRVHDHIRTQRDWLLKER